MSFESTLKLPEAGTPFSLPLAHPEPSATPAPARARTSEQDAMLAKLIDTFNAPEFKLPSTIEALKTIWRKREGASGRGWLGWGAAPKDVVEQLKPLTEVEKCYWSSEAFERCFRAVKWDYAAAVKRAEITLVWRREAKVEEMGPEHVSPEGETGKELIFGYDKECRPVLYMHPYKQNTETGPRQIDFVIWCLERTIDLCPATNPPTEMLCLCIDFGASLKVKAPPTSLGQAKKVLDILQTYYCERLGRAVCVDIPGFFWAFYKLVGPFVDPRTKEKIRFLEKPDATSLIPPSQLQKQFGGDIDFQYDHSTYFMALHQLCMERKAANLERWRKYGEDRCGLSEVVIRGATVPGQEDAEKTAVELSPAGSLKGANGAAVVGEKEAATVPIEEPVPVEEMKQLAVDEKEPEDFVDAPVASKEAVAEAAPAVHA
ncbi:CRAL-TRIO domain-containing protein [Leucosporidium creatinivorum]|uniref:CRAL-TRIO domain-containing protein n=1 Tax=Leucosporidium creatinivorum TaxID=106004 RepID=A0A1Y2F687_9BASI|nr:CRAL-TRIO domain-containing protein [Leucosporidium creatinivorum]